MLLDASCAGAEEIVRRVRKSVCKQLRIIDPSREEELEVAGLYGWFEAIKKLRTEEHPMREKVFLFKCIRGAMVDWLRKDSWNTRTGPQYLHVSIDEAKNHAQEQEGPDERWEMLAPERAKMPVIERVRIFLYAIEEWSVADIAKETQTPYGTIRKTIERFTKRFQERLERENKLNQRITKHEQQE